MDDWLVHPVGTASGTDRVQQDMVQLGAVQLVAVQQGPVQLGPVHWGSTVWFGKAESLDSQSNPLA